MDKHSEDALVAGYEDLINSLRLSDPDDRHVLAAPIRGRVDVIVTYNLRHFPAESFAPLGIEAQHPDDFVRNLFDLSPGLVLDAARRHRDSLTRPSKTLVEYLEMLDREGLGETAAVLRDYTISHEFAG